MHQYETQKGITNQHLCLTLMNEKEYFTVRDKETHELRQELTIFNHPLVHEVENTLIIQADLGVGMPTDGRLWLWV